MKKILVVEDDLALSAGLCFELDTGGYLTVAAYNCAKARQLLADERFDLALMDVNLPDGSGFALCREIKGALPGLPVIFLTANDLEQDILQGFDLGAEDYITKPFRTEILKRRVEVALRRGGGVPRTAEVFWDGFLRLEKLWDCDGNYIDDHTLTVTMNRLRAKIEDETHTYIKTVRGMGYIWRGERL